ncbi:MAG: hypothetical protein L6Q59_15560 [Ignavibacteriaceae bacterium]|nr:hypothetical protein [Ignavibacteriaceae bacterium]
MNSFVKYFISGQNDTVLKLTGADTLDFLHRITTNDLKNLGEGYSRETIFTTEKGRITDLVQVSVFKEYYLLTGHPGRAAALESWLNKFIIADDVTVENLSGKMVIGEIFTNGDNFTENHMYDLQPLSGEDSLIIITTGKNRKRIIYSRDSEPQVKSYLGTLGYQEASADEFDLFRIENLVPWSDELGEEFNPHEVGIIDRVNFRKGCYIGQEVIARLDTYDKVQKSLTRVALSGKYELPAPLRLNDSEGKDAGYLTSSVLNQSKDSWVGLGVIRKAYLEPGTKLVQADGGNLIIEVMQTGR